MQRRSDRITLKGISARGFHGVFEQEREEGQLFVADLVLEVDTRAAARSDELTETVDYGAVSEAVVAILAGQPVNLIETLASRVAAVALRDERVHAVEVTIHKPEAPLSVPFDDVAVTIYRRNLSAPAEQEEASLPAAIDAVADVPAGRFAPEAASQGGVEGDEGTPQGGAEGDEAGSGGGQTLGESGGESADVSAGLTAGAGAILAGAAAATGAAGAAAAGGDLAPASASVFAPEGEADLRWPAPGEVQAAEPEEAAPAADLHAAPQGQAAVVIALGANLGDPAGTLARAVDRLRGLEGLSVEQVSPLVVTAPALAPGQEDQPNYYNAVLTGATTLAPAALLAALHAVEDEFGRVRQERWGARTLDLDLVDYQGVVSADPELTLPHPRAAERAFVLYPWALIAPQGRLADQALTAAELSERAGHAQILQVIEEWPTLAAPAAEPAAEPGTEQGGAPVEPEVEEAAGWAPVEPAHQAPAEHTDQAPAAEAAGFEPEQAELAHTPVADFPITESPFGAAEAVGEETAGGEEGEPGAAVVFEPVVAGEQGEGAQEAWPGQEEPTGDQAGEAGDAEQWQAEGEDQAGFGAELPAFAPVVDLSALAAPAGQPVLASAQEEGGQEAAHEPGPLDAHPFEPIFVPVTAPEPQEEAPAPPQASWEVPAPDPSDVPALETPVRIDESGWPTPAPAGQERDAELPAGAGEAAADVAPAPVPEPGEQADGAHPFNPAFLLGEAEYVDAPATMPPSFAPTGRTAEVTQTLAEKAGYGAAAGLELANDAAAQQADVPPVPAPAPPPEVGDIAPLPPAPPAPPLVGADGAEAGNDDWEAKPSWDQVLGQ
ncbi:2-amino-4-hydroxy-6-hydroxymethyldihydropteridine diphosphokinase [Buchananella felis]|uniref:2-amino-4-hydroxy-6- hydroxymethyldihydropteridine diphosphokinase n=1 Tax=Buchananella felis TaxID=3231492 RepID=UPI0035276989